jgi:hypothetical protein
VSVAARRSRLLGVSNDARAALIGPQQVYLLTGTPITNRPRDLFNLLRCVGHPSSRSFLSFTKRYCDAYKNDYGWVTAGASNLEELNLLMKEEQCPLLGVKQKCPNVRYSPKADIAERRCHVRFVPKADIGPPAIRSARRQRLAAPMAP